MGGVGGLIEFLQYLLSHELLIKIVFLFTFFLTFFLTKGMVNQANKQN